MHKLSFTLKSWAEFLAFVSAMHDWLYLKRPQPLSIFVPPVSGLPLMVGRSTNQKLPHVLYLPSGSPTLHLGITCFVHEIDLHEIFECAHLKFTVYGRKQASKQARTYINTLPQYSSTSVGLAQARPNKTLDSTTWWQSHAVAYYREATRSC